MKVCRVIGSVVLGQSLLPGGGRLVLASPLGRAELATPERVLISRQPTQVVFDHLGAGVGDLIGVTEGGEAMRPFSQPMPIDAYAACLLDQVTLLSASGAAH